MKRVRMQIDDISTFAKHRGKSYRQIFCGEEMLPIDLLAKNIKIVLSWYFPADFVSGVEIDPPEIRIPTGDFTDEEQKWLNDWIRMTLNHFFCNAEDTWNCRTFDELNCPGCYRKFISLQGDPRYIKYLIEKEDRFVIPEEEMEELEKHAVHRFKMFKLHYKSANVIEFKPVMHSFQFKFPQKTKRINKQKTTSAVLH